MLQIVDNNAKICIYFLNWSVATYSPDSTTESGMRCYSNFYYCWAKTITYFSGVGNILNQIYLDLELIFCWKNSWPIFKDLSYGEVYVKFN